MLSNQVQLALDHILCAGPHLRILSQFYSVGSDLMLSFNTLETDSLTTQQIDDLLGYFEQLTQGSSLYGSHTFILYPMQDHYPGPIMLLYPSVMADQAAHENANLSIVLPLVNGILVVHDSPNIYGPYKNQFITTTQLLEQLPVPKTYSPEALQSYVRRLNDIGYDVEYFATPDDLAYSLERKLQASLEQNVFVFE